MTQAQNEIIGLLKQIRDGGGGGGGVTNVIGTAPIASSGGATPAISIAPATPSDPGSMSAADKTKLDTLSAHSGGVIGTAFFNEESAIAGLVVAGIITAVDYTSSGRVEVTITEQLDANYIVSVSQGSANVTAEIIVRTATGFRLQTRDASTGVLADAVGVSLAVLKLSQ